MYPNMMRWGTEAAEAGDRNYWGHHPMMGFAANNQAAFWIYSILWLVTWVLIIAALAALVRWLWKKGDKAK